MTSRPLDHGVLAITGYTDRLSARPGGSVSVHASSSHTSGSLRLVRLDHDGTTFTKEQIASAEPIELGHRHVALGSSGVVDGVDLPPAPVVLHTWVWMTRLPAADGEAAVLLAIDDLALTVGAAGTVAFTAGRCVVTSPSALHLRRWYQVTGGLDADLRPFVVVRPQRPRFGTSEPERVVGDVAVEWTSRSGALVLGRGLDGKLE